ncbi:hypothetical protein AAMO2058_001522500 [Amorphochlora amoebiformis]
MAGDEQKAVKVIKADEVAKHNKDEDVWFIIHGKVYNVTKYLSSHPGGPEIMIENAGKDVSDQFEEFFHSTDARDVLKKYEVGVLEGATEEDWKKLDETASVSSGSATSSFPSYLLPLLVVIIAVVYTMMNQ